MLSGPRQPGLSLPDCQRLSEDNQSPDTDSQSPVVNPEKLPGATGGLQLGMMWQDKGSRLSPRVEAMPGTPASHALFRDTRTPHLSVCAVCKLHVWSVLFGVGVSAWVFPAATKPLCVHMLCTHVSMRLSVCMTGVRLTRDGLVSVWWQCGCVCGD